MQKLAYPSHQIIISYKFIRKNSWATTKIPRLKKKRYASLKVNSDQSKAYFEIGKHALLRNKLQGVTSERNETPMA